MEETHVSIVEEMRTHARGRAEVAFYDPESWWQLCDRLDGTYNRDIAGLKTLVSELYAEIDVLRKLANGFKDALNSVAAYSEFCADNRVHHIHRVVEDALKGEAK